MSNDAYMDTQMTQRGPFGGKPKLSLMVQETTSNSGDIDMLQTTSGGINMLTSSSSSSSSSSSGGRPKQLDSSIDLNASFQVSANDTLRAGGFVIKPSGITSRAPPINSRTTAAAPGAAAANQSQPGFTHANGELSFNAKDLVELGSIGKGACGVVTRYMHLPSLQVVALKNINIWDKEKRHQFVKELTALNAVDSPYIVKFFGATYSDGAVNILLEYANRLSLLEMLKLHGPFEEVMVQRIALHTCRGLELLHSSKVIHRDIKLGNILINSNVECKLTDFGTITALEGTMDLAKTFVGTVVFMAPERVLGDHYSYPSDIWSFGVSMYYLAVGQLPYPPNGGVMGIAKSIRDDPFPSLPPVHPLTGQPYSDAFRDFLAHCVQKDVSKRATASQLLHHPFLLNADQVWSQVLESRNGIVHPIMNTTDADRADLDAVLRSFYQAQYAGGRAEYRKSLMELARFQKLAENLNHRHINATTIQTRFEEIYKEMKAQGK